VPPFVGVAVKVTLAPAQIAPAGEAEILTAGTNTGLTVMLMAEEVAVAVEGQATFVVITTVTAFPFVSVVLVKVAPVAPATFTPPICH
jgi:hypothetical protein